MTLKPEELPSSEFSRPNLNEYVAEQYVFENLFLLGYAESAEKTIYKSGNVEIIVKFRTLTPVEMRDVIEEANQYTADASRGLTERIETLSRAIVTLNHAPLVLTKKEQDEYFNKHGMNPSPLAMARIIFKDKIKSLELINLLYDEYVTFTNQITDEFEKSKKK